MNTYLITGAAGYIGAMIVKYIRMIDEKADITALVRNKAKAEKVLPYNVQIAEVDLTDGKKAASLNLDCDYLIHCASITGSAEMLAHPVEVTESIINTTQNVLELARRCQLKSMVYLSSMEVYGNIDCPIGHRVTEKEVSRGAVELLASRSCYPLGKRMAENICYSYYKEYGVPVKIARLSQTFGEGVPSSDKRVFSQFAKAVRENCDIVLHTWGLSMGNYCGIHDAISGIITILEKGTSGEAYNVVNESNTMTIRQMAKLVADKMADGRIKVVYDVADDERYGYAADTALRLSGEKLMSLGWRPEEDLEDMYSQLIKDSASI
ncbi:NAD-dependent epimerase/dehydratase family protein [Lachnospiraceae bacterium WCA-9-b2]|jgi:nucleoside-diphosphate-sugar epimerase|uniref:NAD-dependent epimerase/dehydratase family protein n=1 Tax=Sporofaciens musculi TaxID=2681861 RepID=A0A7X3MGE3_9FIRM|nr:NAD(P)-dependent oxidoreductase [Sporofaciens musculi]MXP75891.1 NAD-dependent epimerase/dehydratase family protein [Sporofaciens musculi]